ncbi:MAG TPA: hypothetical protein VN711_01315, partial [Candidatus Saccharimonadales bacterium]|nr:hypothetical protein [Candidatus Saccharimonadales bacterium]
FFHIINDKNAVFVYPVSEWIQHPLRFFLGNLSGLWNWFIGYMSWPILIALVASLFVWKKYSWEKLLLIIYFAAPFFALALFGKVLYPRFILFMTVILLPMLALLIYALFERMKHKIWAVVITVLLLVLWVRADYFIVTNFPIAPIPQPDLMQYSNDWPAGGGIHQIISYLGQQAQTHKIYVASEGTFGSLPTYAVEIYLGENTNVEKGGIWPVPADIPTFLLKDADVMPTYMIFNQTQLVPSGWPLKLIAKYQKGVGNSYISLYQVIPPKSL